MSNVGDIFKALREQSQAVNESVVTPEEETTEPEETVNEEIEEVVKEETPEEETPVTEETKEETPEEETPEEETLAEEFSVICCPHCGPISGMNESAVDECPICGEDELLEKVVKVVRDGEVVKKTVKTKKTILSPAQKAALAKARKKAHTAGANKQRAKSNKVRKNKINDEDYLECPECGFSGDVSEFEEEDGKYICPDCGSEVDGVEDEE